jgi:3-oxoadipate enol-lactonase
MVITANGIKMNYEISGKDGAPVVVLSHSLGSSLKMWGPQMESLRTHFQVLRYDTRGHGGTESPSGPYTLETLGEDAIALLDALKFHRVHFVGLSMGGMIGQYLGLNHPARLLRLVLCSTAAVIPQEAQPLWDQRIQTARTQGLGALVDATMERWFTAAYLRKNSSMLGIIRREFLETAPEGFIGCCEAIRRLNFIGRLPAIRIPTAILVGEDDPGTPVSASQAIQEKIAGSKLTILPAAKHLANIEKTEAFNSALLSFLRGAAS